MNYSLDISEVKKVVQARLSGKSYDRKQFEYYHLHRNFFNVKNEITSLKHIGGNKYIDNLGNEWEVQKTLLNLYHMPKGNWAGSMLGISDPYSRKFLRDDTLSGLDGEFEMIIRHDGKRIDALTHEDYQETYNFGRTRNDEAHKNLDVYPHYENRGYTFKMDMGSVKFL